MPTIHQLASLPLEQGQHLPVRLRSQSPCIIVRLGRGEVLVREGDGLGSWHLVLSGAIALSSTSPAGRRSILEVCGPGDLVSPPPDRPELPGVAPEAQALLPSTAWLIPCGVLDGLVRLDGEVASWLCSKLRRNASRLQARLDRTLSLRVRDRVVRTLWDLARTHGRPTQDGLCIDVPMAQETVASMVGASRESINRALKRLEAEGAVSRSGARYVLLTGSDQPAAQDEPATMRKRSSSAGPDRTTRPSRSNLIRWASSERAAAPCSSGGKWA